MQCTLLLMKSKMVCVCLPIRQPVNSRARHPQQEASPQEPEEPEEILGSDDEEQEDPNDYCKGKSRLIPRLHCSHLTNLTYSRQRYCFNDLLTV